MAVLAVVVVVHVVVVTCPSNLNPICSKKATPPYGRTSFAVWRSLPASLLFRIGTRRTGDTRRVVGHVFLVFCRGGT